jgi:hypothetical protein
MQTQGGDMDSNQMALIEGWVCHLATLAALLNHEVQCLKDELHSEPRDHSQHRGAIERRPQPKQGDFGREVRRIAQGLAIGFSVSDIQREMQLSGLPILGTRTVCNIGNILRRMVSEGTLKQTAPGSGRRPARYDFCSTPNPEPMR